MSVNLKVGTTLSNGTYRIVRFISSGGFGCTYEAQHIMLQKRVAVKEFFYRKACNRDPLTGTVTVAVDSERPLVAKLFDKFIDEARALSQMKHPGIVNVTNVFKENGTAYYVMDYIDGHSLDYILADNGPLNERQSLRYIRQVSDALKYVHDHDRLHLDIKPGNIMIDSDGNAILIDFGSSRQYTEADGENTSTVPCCTKGFAPQEQMNNSISMFCAATDIYALGATLYKLLTGITPLSSTLIDNGQTLEPLPSDISAPTRDAVKQAMRTEISERPQTIPEFLKILNTTSDPKIDITQIDGTPQPPEKPEPGKPQIPHFTAIATAIAFIVCMALAFIFRANVTEGIQSVITYLTSTQKPNDDMGEQTAVQTDSTLTAPDTIVTTPEPVKEKPEETKPAKEPSGGNTTTTTEKPKKKPQASTLNLGYGTWRGDIRSGKPHGSGTLTFTKSHKVADNGYEETIASPGDYLEAEYDSGYLVEGYLYDSNGNLLETVIP